MCRLNTEGTKHGCGHYIINKTVSKEDCNNPRCKNSKMHPAACPSCKDSACTRYFLPDQSETPTSDTDEYCELCEYWYKGPGATRREFEVE